MALTDTVEIPKKTMVVFLIVNTAGVMDGTRIGATNYVIGELIPEIRDISNGLSDAIIKIAALEYSSGAKWLTPDGPVDVNDFKWKNLDAGGLTNLGAAFKALNEKMSAERNGFMPPGACSFAPVLFLLSGSEPTDDWENELKKLKKNVWYMEAIKIAINIEDEADKKILSAFTGSLETVLGVEHKNMLRKMIKFKELGDMGQLTPDYDDDEGDDW